MGKHQRFKKYSLFIGRWQPLHDGHKFIIQKVLDEGKNVVIGIRNTPRSPQNPFTLQERWKMIRDAFPDKKRVKIMFMPDIEEVCFGRKVGWGIRDLSDVPEEIANISATKIRKELNENNSS